MQPTDWEVKTFVMMGRPASGKGIQAKLLAKETDFKIFSTGKRYREIAKEDSFRGQKIREIIDAGWLTPYWFASYLFEEEILNLPRTDGIIFEGTARKVPEAELFDEVLRWLERPYVVFYIDVSEAVARERTRKRLETEHRADDEEEHFATRMKEFADHTLPALEVFREKEVVYDINGEQEPEEVHADIMTIVRSINGIEQENN